MVISGTPIPEAAPLVDFPQGTVNIVLLGSDKRPNDLEWRTDTVIVASVNPNVPSVTMLSIPRDLWLYIPGWMFQRINLADVHGASSGFPGGGPGLLKQTIQYNLGLHVDYYARVDFAGFMKIIDALGGIDVVADCPLQDVFPDDPITEDPTITGTISIQTPGVYHLDGKHALWYARSRYTSPGGDLDRSRRQHRVLRGLWNKATELNALARLPDLWNQLSTSIETDLSWNDIVWLASLAPRLDNSHIRSGFIDGDALQPWTTPSKASVYVPNIERMLEQVQETFNPPSNIAAQAPAQVEVWNGTPYANWDILATDRLQWAGYLVPAFRSADRQDYARTQIIDFTSTPKGSRLPALMRLFQVSQTDVVSQPDPNSPIPYRIIVGADYDPCVRPAMPHRPIPTPTPAPSP
jgi:LCP family protein required for cell wall assembly